MVKRFLQKKKKEKKFTHIFECFLYKAICFFFCILTVKLRRDPDMIPTSIKNFPFSVLT